ncbi:MAG: carbamoyltransferase family protein [Thermoanaerobaculia bacterium]
MKILGISCFYHDAAACLLDDGRIVAAAQEERFSRIKHDAAFPARAIRYCLAAGGVGVDGLDAVAFYEKPLLKFHRLLESYLAVAPRGLRSFVQALPVWMRQKLWIPYLIERELERLSIAFEGPIYFPEHHESHAASAFFPSPFEEAAVVTLDGVGEWATTTVGVGEGSRLRLLHEIRFPHSLGLLYSAFTYFTGFKVNSGEYKLMGLAPYGEPRYAQTILDELIDLKEDGSFRLDMRYFGYLDSLRMTNRRFDKLFGGPPRRPETPITRREMDLARSVQAVIEEAVLRIARHARELTGKRDLCLAGGVALNCVANGRLLDSGIFHDLWIQPAAGDAGGAMGAALAAWHGALERPRRPAAGADAMSGAYLGPQFPDSLVRRFLAENGYPFEELAEEEWPRRVASLVLDQKVVGLCRGRMEYGPRALGNRSILGDARSTEMQSLLNLKIKFRESFRPFAPAVLEERAADYFELDRPSPYMLLVADVQPRRRRPLETGGDDLLEQVRRPRSDVPAVTHVDYSARIQTVSARTNPDFHRLLTALEAQSGTGLVVNTSFNVRGEPIVCTPEDAYRCFMRTEMDYLLLGNCLLARERQTPTAEDTDWRQEFPLD